MSAARSASGTCRSSATVERALVPGGGLRRGEVLGCIGRGNDGPVLRRVEVAGKGGVPGEGDDDVRTQRLDPSQGVGCALVEPPPFARRQIGVQGVVHQRVREPERTARVAGLAEQAGSRRQIDAAGDGLGVEVRHSGHDVLD